MASDKVSIDFDFNGVTFRISGAKYFYGDAGVQATIGCDITDDNDLGGRVIVDHAHTYKRTLIPLVAVMSSSSIGNVGSSIQSGKKRYFEFLCNPRNVDNAFEELPGTDVDANLLPGDWKIIKVQVPQQNDY